MLNSSYLPLVIQKSAGADSFLPSKLTNILAAGCASVVTANPETSLHEIISKGQCGIVVKPDSSDALKNAIIHLYKNEEVRNKIKKNARKWAKENLSIEQCLKPLIQILS